MRRRLFLSGLLFGLAVLLALSGCSVVQISSSSRPPGEIPTPIVGVITSSGGATAGPAVTSNPAATDFPTPGGALSGDNLNITLADQGKTLTLAPGQRFLLDLGEGFDWSPVVGDPAIVSRVPNISVIRGAQGIYEAHAPGQTTLTVTGDPTCRQSTPPCMAPSRMFSLTIVVKD